MKITKTQLRKIIRRTILESAGLLNEDLETMMGSFESVGAMLTGSKADQEQIWMLSGEDADALNQVFDKYLNHVMQKLVDQVVAANPKVEETDIGINVYADAALWKFDDTRNRWATDYEPIQSSEEKLFVRGEMKAYLKTPKRQEIISISVTHNRNLDKFNWHLQNMYYSTGKTSGTRVNELNLYSAEEAIAKAVQKLKGRFR